MILGLKGLLWLLLLLDQPRKTPQSMLTAISALNISSTVFFIVCHPTLTSVKLKATSVNQHLSIM